MLNPPRETRAAIAAVWRWWDGSTKDRERPKQDVPHEITRGQEVEPVDPLRERVRALHLDPNAVLDGGSPVAKELQQLCARCESRGRCLRDIVDEFSDPAWQAWRDYCPNATALTVLSTLRGCDEVESKSE